MRRIKFSKPHSQVPVISVLKSMKQHTKKEHQQLQPSNARQQDLNVRIKLKYQMRGKTNNNIL